MQLLVTALVAGVTLGLLFSLFAAGMGLVVRGTGEFNLAHGDVLVLATFVALGAASATRPTIEVVAAAVAVGAAIGAVSNLAVYAPVRRRATGRAALLGFLPSLGVALVARNLGQVVLPAGSRPVGTLFPGPSIDVLGVIELPPATLWLVVSAVVVPLVLTLVLARTSYGMNLRAVSDDETLAKLSGIPVDRTLTLTYALAGAIGAYGGVLYGAFFGELSTSLGWEATLASFVAVVVGGSRSIWGSFAGALAVAVVGSLAGAYVSTTFKDVTTFVLVIVVLMVFPQGVRRRLSIRSG